MREFLNNNKKKIVLAVIGIFFCMGYSFFAICVFAQIPLNSDLANMMLEADDILNGNLFLTDWTLTGISFLTTDLLFFIVGTLFFGVSIKGYVFSISLMFLALIAAGALLLSDKFRLPELLFLIAVAGFPCFYWASILRIHTGCFVWVLVGLSFLWRANLCKKHQKLMIALAVLFLTLSVTGDSIALLAVILPLLLTALINVTRSWFQKEALKKEDIRSIAAAASAFLLGTALDKLYIFIGGADKNVFLESKFFEAIEDYPKNFHVYIQSLFGMFDADFSGQKLLSADTLFFFLRGCIIVLGIIVIFHTIICFVKGKACDFINLILSIGFLLISVVFLLTDISVDIMCGRYFVYAPVMFCVILIRKFRELRAQETNERKKKLTYTAIILCSVLLFLKSFFPIPAKSVYYDETQLGLLQVLEENNLKNGYGGFWDASVATVYAQKQVSIRAVAANENGIFKFNWFCKNTWYDEYADYVVVSPNAGGGITADTVLRSFGTPKDIIHYGIYDIYVYDYDISKRLLKQ